MLCVCGKDNWGEAASHEGVLVDVQGRSHAASIAIITCQACGLKRQFDFPFADEETFKAYYREKYPPTGRAYSAKDYESDRKAARLRAGDYNIRPGECILDVGCGSGAFVDECRALGAEAYGCEIGAYSYRKAAAPNIYCGRMEEVNFPTDHFDQVTAYDVVEHVLSPRGFLAEVFRITRQRGHAIFEIPDFFGENGAHHWKKDEHLWYCTAGQFEGLLKEIGFSVADISRPTESKLVFRATKPAQHRPKILVPPGIGDSYWSIIKMRAFLSREGLGIPDIYVAAPREMKFDGHKRAFPFIEMFPFLASSGITIDSRAGKDRKLWLEAYAQQGRTIFKDVLGMDYFLSYNGHLRVGKQLEEVDPDLACNWIPPMFVSLEQERYRLEACSTYGNYIVFYFVFQGTYCHWTAEFPIPSVISFIQKVVKKTGCTPVFAGAKWDGEDPLLNQVKAAVPNAIDLVGKTSLPQLFGLLRGAAVVVGYPSGLTIASAMLRQKTLVIWNDFYNRDFAQYAMPPEVRGVTYFAANTKGLQAESLAERVAEIVGEIPVRELLLPPAVAKPKPLTFRAGKEVPARLNLAEGSSLAIVCILTEPFGLEDVRHLRDRLRENTTYPYRFYCLTDQEIPEDLCARLPLNGWQWSPKLELFRPGLIPENWVLYLDLDTRILGNIDSLLAPPQDFLGLRPWKGGQRGGEVLCLSGMMSWKNDGTYTFLREEFRVEDVPGYPQGDREYISRRLKAHGKELFFFQDIYAGLYSWRSCPNGDVPWDARIVCYHGHPMPREEGAA